MLGALVLSGNVVSAAGEDFSARVDAAKDLEVEKVCAPMRTNKHYRPILVPNPDGKTYDVILRYYENYWGSHTLSVVDLSTGKMHTETVPSALPDQHRFHIGPDGRFYQHWQISGVGKVLKAYDPKTNTWTDAAKKVPVGGEVQPLTTGTDGLIYGAGSLDGEACAYQYDPATGKITDYGKMGPSHKPNACWGYSVAADDEYVYVASGKIPWYVVAYNKKTGEDSVLLTMDDPKGHVGVGQGRYGCTVISRGHGKTERYWLYKGKISPVEKGEAAPWPEPEEPRPWVVNPPEPELGTARLQPGADGWCELWYKQPGTEYWSAIGFDSPTYPVPLYRVTALPDGRICGSGGNYLGNFLYDPKTDESSHPGIIHLSHYASTVAGGKVYMSGYPSSALFVWDPESSWTANKSLKPYSKPLGESEAGANPRKLCYLNKYGSGCHKMWSAATGADGKVYFGGRWARNGLGGGLGWWDTAEKDPEKAAGGISRPFANYRIIWIDSAADGRYIVISTRAVRDQATGTPAPKSGKIFLWDTEKGALVHDFAPVQGANISGAVAGLPDGTFMGITYDPSDRPETLPPEKQDPYLKDRTLEYGVLDRHSILYRADPRTGKILWKKTLPYAVGFRTNENFAHQDGFDFRLGPDGRVWTFTGARFNPVNPDKSWHYAYTNCRIVKDEKAPDGFRLEEMNCALVRIDPADGSVEVAGKLSHTGSMAFLGRDLYLSGGDKYLIHHNKYLRRCRNIVPAPAEK